MSEASTIRDPRALLAVLAAFLVWGAAPLYFKAVGAVPPTHVLAARVLCSLPLLVAALLWLRGRRDEARRVLHEPRTLAALLASAALIGGNWLLYIWAVGAKLVLETSIGYFINPLVAVLCGAVFFGERLRRPQTLAVLLALVGALLLIWAYGRPPWVALGLALSFALYTSMRKALSVDALVGLAIEVALMTPAALLYAWRHRAALPHTPPSLAWLLVAAGPVTIVPLGLFISGARRLPLSTVGLLQYLSPTCQFLIAVLVFREPFTKTHLLAFGFIWAAVILGSLDAIRGLRR